MSSLGAAWSAWRRLAVEYRQAAGAAVGLVLALFLPWYEKSIFVIQGGELLSAHESLTAFEVISYVEGAVMLVAAGVLALVYTRARRLPFHLPGGDGLVVAAGGVWATGLLVWRLFDKPDAEGTAVTVGVQWGWFVAVVLAVALIVYGLRLRAASPPEPPNPAADPQRPDLAGDEPAPGERVAIPADEAAGEEEPAEVAGARPAGAALRGADDDAVSVDAPAHGSETQRLPEPQKWPETSEPPGHDEPPAVPQAVDEPRVPPTDREPRTDPPHSSA